MSTTTQLSEVECVFVADAEEDDVVKAARVPQNVEKTALLNENVQHITGDVIVIERSNNVDLKLVTDPQTSAAKSLTRYGKQAVL